MNYKNLEVWQMARELVTDIQQMTIKDLPRYEFAETGREIRRSIKAVKSNIVEGYGIRNNKEEFIHYIVYSMAYNDATIDHLETLHETGSLLDQELYKLLHRRLEILGKKLAAFLQAIHNAKTLKVVKDKSARA